MERQRNPGKALPYHWGLADPGFRFASSGLLSSLATLAARSAHDPHAIQKIVMRA
jgi:hypothetical protein